MSGRWMTAGDRFAEYCADSSNGSGDGRVNNLATRVVLQQLCRVAHDAGIAQVSISIIAERLGMSVRSTKYAMDRLQRDGWIVRAVKGTGNRHGTQPRASVWVIRPLPDRHGELRPDRDWIALQWHVYVASKYWQQLDRANREAVRTAYSGPVDNGLQSASGDPTKCNPLHHSSQVGSQVQAPAQTHPRAAARRRGRLASVKSGG